MSALMEQHMTVKKGTFLTNGDVLVEVRRVLTDSVLVIEAAVSVEDEADAALSALTPDEIAANWREVRFDEEEIPDQWRLSAPSAEEVRLAKAAPPYDGKMADGAGS